MPATVAITLPFPVPPHLADELSEDLGVHPHIDQRVRAIDPTAPGIVVATALGLFASGMIQQFGAEAANRLMRGLARLRRSAGQAGQQDLELIDEANDIVIHLGPEAIGDERAMAALVAQERDVFRPGVQLRWNPDIARWQASLPDQQTTATACSEDLG
jgi:hypothetical protein